MYVCTFYICIKLLLTLSVLVFHVGLYLISIKIDWHFSSLATGYRSPSSRL